MKFGRQNKAETASGPDSHDEERDRISKWLAAISTARQNNYVACYLDGEGLGKGILVTPENADKVELQIRVKFADAYPDLLDVYDTDAPEIVIGERQEKAD